MRRSRLLVITLVLASPGCTLEKGRGFAHLSASLASSFRGLEPDLGRTLEGGWLKTAGSYALQLSQLELGVRELRLLRAAAASSSSSTPCSFDPQNPPAGCTLCHNDHCHCDGKLRTYDELRAEVCGGGGAGAAPAVTLARLPVVQPQGLLGAGTRQDLSSCSPSCELGEGTVDELHVVLDRLRAKGIVRDVSDADRLGGKQPSVTIDWELGGAALAFRLASAGGPIQVGRDQPYDLLLRVSVPVTEKLFDAIAWEGLASGSGGITIDKAQNSAAGEQLTQSLTLSALGVQTLRDSVTPPDAGPGHAEAGASVNSEGCEHLAEGPFVEVQGVADPKLAPEVRADHQAYRVTLPVGAVGYVELAAGAAGDRAFFLDADLPLSVSDDRGAPIATESSEKTIPECAVVKAKHTIAIPAVGSYRIKLGPSATVSKLTLVIEEADHAH
jgi:hypothetical protein